MNSNEIVDKYNQFVMHTYAPSVALSEGKGCKVRNPEGGSYLDFTSGISVHNVGHCHPKVVKAVQDQVSKLGHSSNLFFNENQALLAERLSRLTLNGKCFFCNSGAEANEAMVKLARLWGHEKGKYEVITMVQSFHGRTLGMIAATGQVKVQNGFEPLPVGFAYAEFNNLESVKEAITDKTVAVLVEAVQGEGGIHPATEEFMVGLRQLCDEKDLLLLCDEVQCGMGRTGKWWGWQHYPVKPDAFSIAKSLADGVPMGALVSNAKFADVFTPGAHASTFGGNPLAAAAALAVIKIIEDENLLEAAQKKGELLREGLKCFAEKYEKILDVRGLGCMIGMVVDGDPKEIVDAFRDMGILALTAHGNVVRFLPTLSMSEKHLEEAVEMMGDALEGLYGAEE